MSKAKVNGLETNDKFGNKANSNYELNFYGAAGDRTCDLQISETETEREGCSVLELSQSPVW